MGASSMPSHLRPAEEANQPTELHMPDAARAIPVAGDPEDMVEDADSLLGFSIGPEQIRLISPATPAAERAAALDGQGGFYDDAAEEDEDLGVQTDEETARNTASNHGPDRLSGRASPQSPASSTLPSPWQVGPRLHEIGQSNGSPKTRSRTGTSVTNAFADLNIKRFMDSFNVPSFKLPSFSEAVQRFSTTPEKTSEVEGARKTRSNSLFLPRMPWSQPVKRREGSQSPRRPSQTCEGKDQATPVLPADESGLTEISQGSSRQSQATLHDRFGTPRPEDAIKESDERSMLPLGLRRSTSDTSLARASTLNSFDDDNPKFENHEEMVNSRMKAVKDSWQDSAFRLPSVASVRRLSLKPDFLKRDETPRPSPRAMSTVFGGSGTNGRTRSLTPPSRSETPKLRHQILDEALDDLTGDVVLMGGYRGSILRSTEPPNHQVWVPIKVGLNIRKVNLEVGFNEEDDEQEQNRIYSSGILSHIGPIDISKRLIRKFKHCHNVRTGKFRFHNYGYDWRLSPEMLGRRLIAFLQELPCNRAGVPAHERGATIIAHSLGGLITRWAINHRPDLFAGVVYAGTPQHCVNILGPLRNGDDVLLSSRVLTAQVNFSFRTSFVLLPESGQCFIDKETKEEYPVDFFDPKAWEEYRFSPCIKPCLPAVTHEKPERRNSIFATLHNAVPTAITSKISALTSSVSDGYAHSNQQTHPNTTEHTDSTVLPSPVRDAGEIAARKAADVSSPVNQTFNPGMTSQPVSGPATTVTVPYDQAMAYLTRTLASVQSFKQALVHDPTIEAANAYPPHAVMYSASVPTVYGAKVSGRDGIKRADAYDNLAFAAGDGVVLAKAAMLPKGYRVCGDGRVKTDRGHVGLLGDLDGVGRGLAAITKARRQGVGIGAHKIDTAREEGSKDGFAVQGKE